MTGWSVRGRHLPALDGLRALAVLAVLCYHLGFFWARGGYLGVDLFFVLSGFLITSLLLEEHEDRGTIRLGSFWIRRARRLLPALFVMVAAVFVFIVLEGRYGNTDVVAGIDLSSLRDQALATLLYVANWQQVVTQHSYFAQFSAPSPLQHTWSLAIEEQFYLVWPFVTLGLVARGLVARRRLGIVVTVVLAIASTVLMAVLFQHAQADPYRVYYGTDTRLADLAIGAALAWLTVRRPDTPPRIALAVRIAAPFALGGLLVLMALAGSAQGVPSAFMFDGGFLLASILCAIVIADVRLPNSTLAAGFRWRPIVAIGIVSYGIYLWHWPVIVLVTPASSGLSGSSLLVARLAIIAGFVLASYYLVEQPVRRRLVPVTLRFVLYPCAIAFTVVAVLIGTDASFVVRSYVHVTLVRYAPGAVVPGAGGLAEQRPIVVPKLSAADPLRIVLVGDSTMVVDFPGIAAAIDSTGRAVVTEQGAYVGWGTTTDASWRSWVRHAVTSSHAELVMVTTGWDGTAAMDTAAYESTMLELVRVARSAGASGVVFLQYPLTQPLDESPTEVATTQHGIEAWNADVAALPALAPGLVMYFPVAPSVEVDGAFTYWVAPPSDPSAPKDSWDRVRRLDGVHLCPAGIELFASALAADTRQVFGLPAPKAGWWVNGWQRATVITSGDQYCPYDHPGSS